MTKVYNQDTSNINELSVLDCIEWTDFIGLEINLESDISSQKTIKKLKSQNLKMKDLGDFLLKIKK